MSHTQLNIRNFAGDGDGGDSGQSSSFIMLLPPDILILFISCLSARDIIRFRQTCKYICECTHERVVWLSALRRACMEYGAFRPSFPEQDMSTHQLERTATSPARFTSYLRQNLSSSPLVPTYIQKLSLGNTQSPLRNYVLVPGGRYLFTALDSGKIQLWDLGPHAGVSISPEPVASMVVKLGQLLKCHEPTTDGQGLTLVVWVAYYEVRRLDVYEIYPAKPLPTFRLKNYLILNTDENQNMSVVDLIDDILFFNYMKVITIWNIIQDTRAQFEIDAWPEKIIIVDSNIIVYTDSTFEVYKLPALLSPSCENHSTDLSTSEITQPLVILKVPQYNQTASFPEPNLNRKHCFCGSRSSSLNSRRVDAIVPACDESCAIVHFAFHTLEANQPSRWPRCLPLVSGLSYITQAGINEAYLWSSVWTGPEEMLQYWDVEGDLMAGVCQVQPSSDEPIASEAVVGTIWVPPSNHRRHSFEVCSFTGRLAIASDARSLTEIWITDFLT